MRRFGPAVTRQYAGYALIVVLAIVAYVLYHSVTTSGTFSGATSHVALVPPPGSNLKPARGTPRYSVDVVSQGANTATGGTDAVDVAIDPKLKTTVLGWAIDGNSKLASKVYLVIDGTNWIPAIYGETRMDVARVLVNPALSPSGFHGTIQAGALTTGRHSLAIAIVDASGAAYYTGFSNATLVVGGA